MLNKHIKETDIQQETKSKYLCPITQKFSVLL